MAREDGRQDIIKNGPTITPEMINLVHQTLETRGLLYHSEGKIYIPTENGWRVFSDVKRAKDEVNCHGSAEITASSSSCIGLAKSEKIGESKEGDSIIGVKADKSCKDLGKELKGSLKCGNKVKITIEAGDIIDEFEAFGSPALVITDEGYIMIRKDDHIDEKTVAIMADKSACDLKKELIEKLKDPETKVKLTISIK